VSTLRESGGSKGRPVSFPLRSS